MFVKSCFANVRTAIFCFSYFVMVPFNLIMSALSANSFYIFFLIFCSLDLIFERSETFHTRLIIFVSSTVV